MLTEVLAGRRIRLAVRTVRQRIDATSLADLGAQQRFDDGDHKPVWPHDSCHDGIRLSVPHDAPDKRDDARRHSGWRNDH